MIWFQSRENKSCLIFNSSFPLCLNFLIFYYFLFVNKFQGSRARSVVRFVVASAGTSTTVWSQQWKRSGSGQSVHAHDQSQTEILWIGWKWRIDGQTGQSLPFAIGFAEIATLVIVVVATATDQTAEAVRIFGFISYVDRKRRKRWSTPTSIWWWKFRIWFQS